MADGFLSKLRGPYVHIHSGCSARQQIWASTSTLTTDQLNFLSGSKKVCLVPGYQLHAPCATQHSVKQENRAITTLQHYMYVSKYYFSIPPA